MELRLLPKRPISWIIWVVMLVILMPRYYSTFPFPELALVYESEMWTQPNEVTVGENWQVIVRSPKAVSDFTDVLMSVSVRNRQSSPVSAEVSVSLDCREGDDACKKARPQSQARIRGSEQNNVFLENIPANGEVTTWFELRTVIGNPEAPSPTLVANVLLNQKRVSQSDEALLAVFDRDQVFRLWAIGNLLSPPGSNILIPIFLLFIVVLAEIVADMVVLVRNDESRRELKEMYFGSHEKAGKNTNPLLIGVRWMVISVLTLIVVAFLVSMMLPKPLSILGPFFSNDPLNVKLRHVILGFIVVAILFGGMLGIVASTRKQQPPKA